MSGDMNPQIGTGAPTELEKTVRCAGKNDKPRRTSDPRKSNRVMSYIIPPSLVMAAIFSTYVWFDMCIQLYLHNGYRAAGICLLFFQILILLLMSAAFFQVTGRSAGYLPNRDDRNRLSRMDLGESGAAQTMACNNPSIESDVERKTYDRKPSRKEIEQFLSMPRLDTLSAYIARPDAINGPRYCTICDVDKYDRVHHCTEVNRCIKKFDHFCPWVGGPIGFTRYKFFFQFITYVAIYCVYLSVTFGVAVSQRRRAINKLSDMQHIPANPGLWYACIALGGFFALMMVPFSIFHGRQISLNKTTIEYIETRGAQIVLSMPVLDEAGRKTMIKQRMHVAPDTHPFDLGIWQNWQQVLGIIVLDRWLIFRLLNWILPVCGSPGDGLQFPYNEELMRKLLLQANQQL